MEYRRELIIRFWDEAKATHPHVYYCFMLVKNLVDVTEFKQAEKEKYLAFLQKYETHILNGRQYDIKTLDMLYSRYSTAAMSETIQHGNGHFKNFELILLVKAIVNALTPIVSRIAKMYSEEYPMLADEEDDSLWE